MYYANPYKNGSRVVNQDNRNEGIWLFGIRGHNKRPEGSNKAGIGLK